MYLKYSFFVMLCGMKAVKAAEEGRQTGGVQMYTRPCHINSFCVCAENLPVGCEGLWAEGKVLLESCARGVGLSRELPY